MAVVWSTVREHKGYIDVASAVGAGTTVTVYLPITREKACPARTASLPADTLNGSGERILVVDDVEEQRELASAMLAALGYSVTAVASGEAALDHLVDHSVDLVVLDMIMDPGIDGLETHCRLRDLRPEIRTIIVSGFSETDRVREAQRLGAGCYLRKPYLIGRLGRAVREELDRE
jgi:two-component system cell cycle sensor histidine kinase/response regulator CckA